MSSLGQHDQTKRTQMRNVFNWLLTSVLAFAGSLVSSQTAPRHPSPSFTIAGRVAEPRSYTLADVQALPAKEITLEYTAANQAQKHAFKGARLYDLIAAAKAQFDAKTKNDGLRWVVQAKGPDG
jgi:hypothetical protein